MSMQRRRRAREALVYRQVKTTDRRGNKILAPDEANPLTLKVWEVPQRSARAEVPGQQQINVVRLGFDLKPEDVGSVGLWSRVEVDGRTWDIVTPPSFHVGVPRHTQHWTVDIRERP